MNKKSKQRDDSERVLLSHALTSLQETSGLNMQLLGKRRLNNGQNLQDASLTVEIGKISKTFSVEIKKRLTNDLLGYVIAGHKQLRSSQDVLVTWYVTPQQAERLRKANVQFLDAAGNVYLNQPPLFVLVTGKKPPEKSLKVKTTRAFTASGLKVIFAILNCPHLVTATLREIAATVGVSLGAVSHALDDLKRAGYLIDQRGQRRSLRNHRDLIRRWCEAYTERLRPKLLIARLSTDQTSWWKEVSLAKLNACWGGEVAAAKLTNYLKPQMKTVYTPDKLPALQVRFGFRPDKGGDIEMLKKFWTFKSDLTNPDIAPALLVYADLMASGDERNAEAAELIYEKYLAQAFGKA